MDTKERGKFKRFMGFILFPIYISAIISLYISIILAGSTAMAMDWANMNSDFFKKNQIG